MGRIYAVACTKTRSSSTFTEIMEDVRSVPSGASILELPGAETRRTIGMDQVTVCEIEQQAYSKRGV
jgi:hypothetical protein